VEVHSTRPAELAKACVAALLSSFRCLTPEARITMTLFVKRTTKSGQTSEASRSRTTPSRPTGCTRTLPPRVQPLALRPTKQFKRDVERMKKRWKDIAKLPSIIDSLVQRNPLGPQYRDHALTGELKGSRDCHVEPDWILIYEQKLDELILFRTGSHSDLFS